MMPSTPEQLREHVKGWPVTDIKAADSAGLAADPLNDDRLQMPPCLRSCFLGMWSA